MNSVGRQAIDIERWPRVARIPEGRSLAKRAEMMERSFERLCQDNGIELVGSGEFVGEFFITRSTGDIDLAIDGAGGVSFSGGNESSTSSESFRPVILSAIDPAFYSRLADSEWLGLREAYLADEWSSDDSPEPLNRLFSAEFDITSLGPLA